jgi:hypothetical protein
MKKELEGLEVHGPLLIDEDLQIVLTDLENLRLPDRDWEEVIETYADELITRAGNIFYLRSFLVRETELSRKLGTDPHFSDPHFSEVFRQYYSGNALFRIGYLAGYLLNHVTGLRELYRTS